MPEFVVPKAIDKVYITGDSLDSGGCGTTIISYGGGGGSHGSVGKGGEFQPLTKLDRCLRSPEIINAVNKWPIGPDGEPRAINSLELGDEFLGDSVGDLFAYDIVSGHQAPDHTLRWTLTDFGMEVLATVLAKRFAGVT